MPSDAKHPQFLVLRLPSPCPDRSGARQRAYSTRRRNTAPAETKLIPRSTSEPSTVDANRICGPAGSTTGATASPRANDETPMRSTRPTAEMRERPRSRGAKETLVATETGICWGAMQLSRVNRNRERRQTDEASVEQSHCHHKTARRATVTTRARRSQVLAAGEDGGRSRSLGTLTRRGRRRADGAILFAGEDKGHQTGEGLKSSSQVPFATSTKIEIGPTGPSAHRRHASESPAAIFRGVSHLVLSRVPDRSVHTVRARQRPFC